jgi:hypothetical protein
MVMFRVILDSAHADSNNLTRTPHCPHRGSGLPQMIAFSFKDKKKSSLQPIPVTAASAFIQNPGTDKPSRGFLDLATTAIWPADHALGLSSLAEGVGTEHWKNK